MASVTAATSASSWLIGVLLCSLSSFGTGISKLAIRKSWLLEEKTHGDTPSTTLLLPRDQSLPKQSTKEQANNNAAARIMRYAAFGFLSVANPILDICALAFASPSILAPFSGVSLAWVVLLSHQMVGEQPDKGQIRGALWIMLGEVLVALFGDHSGDNNHNNNNGEHIITVEELRDSYLDPPFVGFLLASVLVECGFIYTMYHSTHKYWTRFAWGVAGGFITGFWNFIKDAITIVQLTGSVSKLPWSFLGLLLLVAFATAGAGMTIMAECMKRYDATYTSGMYAGSLTLAASIVSAIHYHTFSHLHGSSLILYPIGLGILMMGVGLLMQESQPTDTSKLSRKKEGLVTMTTTNNKQFQSKTMTICRTHDPTGDLRLRTVQLV